MAAAVALTRRNVRVTMLDAGRRLEEERVQIVGRLQNTRPAGWAPGDVQALKEGVAATSSGIPLKRLFGSDFPFRTEGAGQSFEYNNAGLRPSFAEGGLSTVWGGGMLPFHPDDIADWPFPAAELEEGYLGVQSFVPCSGAPNDSESLAPSRQGSAFLADAARSRALLAKRGITVAQARLAVKGNSCERCGLCLYGCPYQLIYNSASTLRELRQLPNFHYQGGVVVERLREENGAVRIDAHELSSQAPLCFEAGRVLLGAGTIGSTAILLHSLDAHGEKIRLQDSFYFLLPLLRFSGTKALHEEALHTLAQAFVLLRDPAISGSFIHFSIYGYNDLMVPALKASVGALGGIEAFSSRALVAGGYLHSKHSPGLWMTVQPGQIHLEGEDTSAAISLAKRAAWKLFQSSLAWRTLALPFAMRFPPPGRGFHAGGSFPMSQTQARFTSDLEGRPSGFARVHLVDASCLPSIPATTITFPVMANAWRIANLAAERL